LSLTFASSSITVSLLLTGSRGGIAGNIFCFLAPMTTADFSEAGWSLLSFVRFGGRGGNDEGSYGGSLTALAEFPSIDIVLDTAVIEVLLDRPEFVDKLENVEGIDSLESRRIRRFSDCLRGGRAGDLRGGRAGDAREGSRGGSDGDFLGCGFTRSVYLVAGGGKTLLLPLF